MEIDRTLLETFLVWVLAGGGAGIVTFFVMDKWIPQELGAEGRRYLSIAMAALLAMAAYAGAVGLSYLADPVTWQGWLESLFAVAFVATGLSQAIHGRARLHGG
jgi:hypothetical protein